MSRSRSLRVSAVALSVLLRAFGSAAAPANGDEAPAPRRGDRLHLAAGTELRLLASPVAPPVAVVGEAAEAEVLDADDGWARVAWNGVTGWVKTAAADDEADDEVAGEAATRKADPSSAAATSGAVTSGAPIVPPGDDAELERVRAYLPDGHHGGLLGPFVLFTDVEDGELVAALDGLADRVVQLYTERYGLSLPSGRGPARPADAGAVALFANAAAFRAFTGEVTAAAGTDLSEIDFAGHTSRHLAALYVADRRPREVYRTLVHELAHLLNRRLLAHSSGSDLPVWLDEGLAGDLDLFPVDDRGRLRDGPLGAGTLSHGSFSSPRPYGPLIALERLLSEAAVGRLESVSDLLALHRGDFLTSPRRPELYALAALWMRYLLSGERGVRAERAATLRGWLGDVADGAPADGAILLARLGAAEETQRQELNRDFQQWLLDLARRLGLEIGR